MTAYANGIYTDLESLAAVRAQARDNPKSSAALREAASQFESLFTHMLLKSMRDASFGDPLFGESDSLYRDLYDQQLSLVLAKGKGLGIADMLVRQLGGTETDVRPKDTLSAGKRAGPGFTSPESFVRTLLPFARDAGHALGVAPEALLAQAALETGWGRAVVAGPNGEASFNLFGIKADSGWSGPRVSSPTLEQEDGMLVRRTQAFRAYGSYAESFEDYVRFLQENPRYADTLRQAHDPRLFVQSLQEAGYATDTRYGAKIAGIMEGATLQRGLKSAGGGSINEQGSL